MKQKLQVTINIPPEYVLITKVEHEQLLKFLKIVQPTFRLYSFQADIKQEMVRVIENTY
ncbi:hypothetical protein [Mammaliicoccus lentus]|uniref:hypothetical protein n=1 Tax=Mammaliicoccus lentus TaxID=42858 RepID=UPI0035152E4A